MTLKQPSYFFRLLVLGAQGVFYNLFCMHQLISVAENGMCLSMSKF